MRASARRGSLGIPRVRRLARGAPAGVTLLASGLPPCQAAREPTRSPACRLDVRTCSRPRAGGAPPAGRSRRRAVWRDARRLPPLRVALRFGRAVLTDSAAPGGVMAWHSTVLIIAG